jgi:hypothetical protein
MVYISLVSHINNFILYGTWGWRSKTAIFVCGKPLLATDITAMTPYANYDNACAERNSYPLSVSEMGNRI